MSVVTKPNTFSAGATIIASEHNDNFDTIYNDYNGNITNANIAAAAGIGDTKLAQITTAGKVHGTSLTGLASVPSAAGIIPSANINTGVTAGDIYFVDTSDELPAVDARNLINLDASALSSGAVGTARLGTGTASSTNYLRGDQNWDTPSGKGNSAFSFSGSQNWAATAYGASVTTKPSSGASPVTVPLSWQVKGDTYQEMIASKFVKESSIGTVNVYAYVENNNQAYTLSCLADVGGQSDVMTTVSSAATWLSGAVDVSGLSDGTQYDVSIKLKGSNNNMTAVLWSVIGIGDG